MISPEYKKAIDLIRAELFPIEHEEDLQKVIQVFKLLIENGHYAGQDDIYQYLIKDISNDDFTAECDRNLASETQRIYEVVKTTIEPRTGFDWNEDWLREQLLS